MKIDQIGKQVMDFQKTAFDNWYSAMSLVQDQAVSTMDMMLNEAAWLPEDRRNNIQNWVSVLQDERNRFKDYVDGSFIVLEKAFSEAPKPAEKLKKAAA